MSLSYIDWLIMLVYFVFVLGIGFALKRHMKTSNDFFLAGRAIPAWVCGLAFISANLGAAGSDWHGRVGRQVRHRHQPFLLDRRDSRDGVRRSFHDAVLLRLEGPQRT
ncbi:MAG TPA: hypothetical protein VFC39_17890 [Acidobacteriaceae bacterium]|nr:hypothetical protein [Acidobacteriaceae bacterium]